MKLKKCCLWNLFINICFVQFSERGFISYRPKWWDFLRRAGSWCCEKQIAESFLGPYTPVVPNMWNAKGLQDGARVGLPPHSSQKNCINQGRNQLVFSGGGQNACNFLYLTTKHVFEIFGGGAIARLPRPLVAGLVFTAFTYRVLFINSCISVHFSYWFLTIAIVFLTTSFYMSLLCQVYCSFRNFWSNEFSWNKVVRGDSTGPPSGTRSEKGLNRCSAASEQLCTGIRPRNVHSSHWR